MKKPINPYRRGTVIWSVMEGDWEDLTAAQIAEVLDVRTDAVRGAISRIKRELDWEVPYVKAKGGGADG